MLLYKAKEKKMQEDTNSNFFMTATEWYERNGGKLEGKLPKHENWFYTEDGSLIEQSEGGNWASRETSGGNKGDNGDRNFKSDGIKRNTGLPPLPKNFKDLPRIDRMNIRQQRGELKIQLEKK